MDKLEKHIKEKLEERTIAPSSKAWDKIAAQLSGTSKSKRNKWYPYAIAASFVGILLFATLLFTKKAPEVEQIQVVKIETQVEKKSESEHKEAQEFVAEDENQLVEIERIPLETSKKLGPKEPGANALVAEQETEQVLKDNIRVQSDELIAKKVEEVVAQVQLLENLKQDVTDAEVDSLLRAAQRDILTNRLLAKNGSVDAMTLLAEVEDELDASFRDEIFDALKTGYFRLRTAVADRNN